MKDDVKDAAEGLGGIMGEVSVRFLGERASTSADDGGLRFGTVEKRIDGRPRTIRRARPEEGDSATAIISKKAAPLTSHSGEPDVSTRSNQITRDDYTTAFTELGAIDPVYDPEMLGLIFEHSNSLRQNVDAYATNIDGFGHRFDPILDLDSSDAAGIVGDAMYLDRLRAVEDADNPAASDAVEYPTDDEIRAKIKEVARRMRMEKARLKYFFEYCSPDTSFSSLRRKTRQDVETTGNAYWEVLRNGAGQIVQFVYIPSFTIRLLPLDPQPVVARQRVRVSPLSFDEIEYTTRTRRMVQVVEGRAVMFKELGDTRVISSETGAIYATLEALEASEPFIRPANELIHFKIHSSRSIYGVPRWIGNLLSVIGSRQAEEVNFNYFENKSVPPLAILISGGRMTSESVTRTESYIESQIKGKRNFHKIMIIEAEPPAGATGDNAGKMKIELKPLTGAQHNDALFQDYDEKNIDKVGQAFRLPRMLRGDIRDFNRACYSADTETLTENGWKLHGEIAPDEKIAVYDPEIDETRFEVPPRRSWSIRSRNRCFISPNEDTDVLVTQRSQDARWRASVRAHGQGAGGAHGGATELLFLVLDHGRRPYRRAHRVDLVARSGVGADRAFQERHRERRVRGRGLLARHFMYPGTGFFVTRRNGKVAIQGNTADAALTFAEMQVFQPERQDFDFIINRKVLSVLGIQFWEFVSLAPVMRDPEAMSNVIKEPLRTRTCSSRTKGAGSPATCSIGSFLRKSRSRGGTNRRRLRSPASTSRQSGMVARTAATTTSVARAEKSSPERAPGKCVEADKRARAISKAVRKHAGRLVALRKALEDADQAEWKSDMLKRALAGES